MVPDIIGAVSLLYDMLYGNDGDDMEFLRSIVLGTLNSAFESGTRQDLGLEKALHVLCVT